MGDQTHFDLSIRGVQIGNIATAVRTHQAPSHLVQKVKAYVPVGEVHAGVVADPRDVEAKSNCDPEKYDALPNISKHQTTSMMQSN